MTPPTPTKGRSGYARLLTSPSSGPRASHAQHFHDDALAAAPVELRVEHLLPRAQIQFAAGDGQHHLVSHQRSLQVCIGVVLTGAMVAIVEAGRRQLLEPHLEVVDE